MLGQSRANLGEGSRFDYWRDIGPIFWGQHQQVNLLYSLRSPFPAVLRAASPTGTRWSILATWLIGQCWPMNTEMPSPVSNQNETQLRLLSRLPKMLYWLYRKQLRGDRLEKKIPEKLLKIYRQKKPLNSTENIRFWENDPHPSILSKPLKTSLSTSNPCKKLFKPLICRLCPLIIN
jgi:hypothetical protein